MPSSFHLNVVQLSDVGRQREINEDAFGRSESSNAPLWAQGCLYIVADGLGGHAAGDVASRLAVATILKDYFESRDWDDPVQGLRMAIERANEAIYLRAQQDAGLQEMGTTVVAAVVQGDQLTLANVGDSRGYLLREGRLEQLTRDHSWVARAVEDGMLTPEQARHHPDRNVIYRSLGAESAVEVQTYTDTLRVGDRVLLCSDGLTDVLADDLIAELAHATDLATAADHLITAANNRGGPDNITVTLIAVESPQAREERERPTPGRVGALRRSSLPEHGLGQSGERLTVPRGLHAQHEESPTSEEEDDSLPSSGRKQSWLRRLLHRD